VTVSFEVVNYRPHEKNTLRGFVDLELTNIGLTIMECTHHVKNGRGWVGYPSRPYETERGSFWQPLISFKKDSGEKFQAAALKAITDYLDRR
jgi:hypothetical protein